MAFNNLNDLKQTIQQEAAQCVKCGLCLPHCPTYMQTENECESPRGRIALMDGFARDQLPLSKKAQLYLDHCLTCRACEAVCPADVAYGKLIDHGRTLQQATHTTTATVPRSLTFSLRHPWLMHFAARLLHFYQNSGLRQLAKKTGLLKIMRLTRADSLLPTLTQPQQLREFYPAQNQEQGRVALFTGCINQLVDQDTLTAAIKVLTHCGYGVYVPNAQRCCGALHQHAGYADIAKEFQATNYRAFQQTDISAIITVASGCAAVLREYPLHDSNPDFAKKIVDINQFLQEITWPSTLCLKPLAQRVALHTPCTLRNVLKNAAAPAQLLQKIPAIELVKLSQTAHCCGAAGLYMLQYPTQADDLLQNTLAQLDQLQPAWIATSNIGCSLHIARALREKHYAAQVVHPVTLLAAQLEII